MKKVFGIVAGALIIAAGVIFAFGELGLAKINVSFDGWWTLFIIVGAVCGLLTPGSSKTGNGFLLILGIYLLLAARGVIEYNTAGKLIVPVIIVLLGIKLISKTLGGEKKENQVEECGNEKVECMAAFSSRKEKYSEKEVKNAKIGAVFGGVKCNLSDAEFDENSAISVLCIFGGAEIIVPENVEVKINAFCLFGGISDKRNSCRKDEKNPKVVVNGFCLFGGADIK